MKKKFVVSVAGVAAAFASLALAGSSFALGYAEVGDAGDLPSSAQTVFGPTGTALTSISGTLTLTNGVSESDLYEIYINSPSTFSASLTGFVPGANNFDSQLALFTLTGTGVALDDDDPVTGSASANLPAGNTLITSRPAGLYYLLVTGSGRYPATTAGSVIFHNFTDGTDPTVVQGPINPAAVFGAYTGNSNEGGNYVIALAGAQFVPVPEPGTYALVFAGLAVLTLTVRRRRVLSR